jgi:c-di-GMP-binding flagellar brake protein YcgR
MARLRKKDRKKDPSGVEAARLKSPEGEMRNKKEAAPHFRERRGDSRINEEDKVVIELLTNGRPPADKTIIYALTKDISPGGVRLTTNMPLPVNTLLKLEIVLSQRRRAVHVMGIVRWWARSMNEEELFEIGIEFTKISPDNKMLLLEHTYKKSG